MIKRISILVLLIAALCYIPASADITAFAPYQLSTSSPTTCTQIKPNGQPNVHSLLSIWNTSTSAQTETLTLFNDAGTCTAADTIYVVVLTAGQVVNFQPVNRNLTGLSYTLSAAVSSNYVYILTGP